MTDPAVEAANRVGKTLPYGFFSKLTSSDLIAAAREALRGWWCWADLRSRRNLPRPIMREARAPRSSGRVSGSLSAATAADTTIIAPLRELHKLTSDEYGRPGLICDDCDHDWPCPTARLIYRGDEL